MGCQSAIPWIFVVLIGVPAIELAVIIQLGGEIGVWPTLIAIFLTAVIGIGLIKWQIKSLSLRAQQRMRAGELPREETFHGICLGLAGLMLLLPGFVSDALGFLLLLPPLRKGLYGIAATRAEHAARRRTRSGPAILDGEFEEIDDDKEPARRDQLPDKDDTMPPPRGSWK